MQTKQNIVHLAIAIFLFFGVGKSINADEIAGDYRKGVYSSGNASLRFIVFTYQGNLSSAEVNKHFRAQAAQLRTKDESAQMVGAKQSYRLKQVALPTISVFVVGYVNETTRSGAWLAADVADRQAFPRHNWLSSTGQKGVIRSDNTGKTEVEMDFKPSGTNQAAVHLGIFAASGWIRWAADWDAELDLNNLLLDD